MPGSSVKDVVILGSGPAGLTAAIYCARANLKPLCVEGVQPGGQLTITTEVENYPGFSKGILGPELMVEFREQAKRFGTEFIQGDVKSVLLKQNPFELQFSNHDKIMTKTLIVSTGAQAKLLGLEAEKRLMGKGVSACATCDGFFFRGVDVAVVGGGDTALEEANFLTKFASTVTVIHRRDTLRASKVMQDRARANPKIRFIWDSVVEGIEGDKEVEAVKLKNLKSGKESSQKFKGVFMAIGHEPNTALFKGQLELDQKGYLLVRPGTTETNIKGVFAAGDVADSKYRQAVTAAGTGCMAAIDVERYLDTLGH